MSPFATRGWLSHLCFGPGGLDHNLEPVDGSKSAYLQGSALSIASLQLPCRRSAGVGASHEIHRLQLTSCSDHAHPSHPPTTSHGQFAGES